MMPLRWECLPFEDLRLEQLYASMALRQIVFVVEQDCPYLDADGKDAGSWHLFGWQGEQLQAYARLLPEGLSYPKDASIGRVVTHPDVRGTGLGVALMEKSIAECMRLWPQSSLRISAQSYLEAFYQRFGFENTGKHYLEDGIPHQEMRLSQ